MTTTSPPRTFRHLTPAGLELEVTCKRCGHVAVVDDHAIVRSSLRARLDIERDVETLGEAGTASQAVQLARSLQPDLVLLDLILPRISGYEAIPRILEVAPKTRILVVSSQTSPTSVRQAISAGAHGYLPKRASDIELVGASYAACSCGDGGVAADDGMRLTAAEVIEKHIAELD